MEITHLKHDLTEITLQVLRATCPKCHGAVEFILTDDDRLYKEDAIFYEKECQRLRV
jgi:hypothetical protein